MNNQEAFDKIAEHLLTQKVQARNDADTNCAYRGRGGTKCAVGCLIPDELYDPDMEGEDAGMLPELFPQLKPLIYGLNIKLLTEIQFMHDNEAPASWLLHLKSTAHRFCLSPEVLNKFE